MTQSRAYKSVFFTSSFVVALCTAIVTATLASMHFNSAQQHADDSVRLRATEVTTLIAKQSGGALKFRKVEVFEGLISDAINGSDTAALAGTVFTESGQALTTIGDPAVFNDGLDSLVRRALESGKTVYSADRFTAIVPVRFGEDNAVVGLVAMRWTAEFLKERHFRDQLIALFVSGLVFLSGLAGAVLFLRTHISRPLVRLRDAMAEVAAENYGLEIPGVGRGDEVGEIARTLESFRDVLNEAAGLARDNIFKSAAFEDSTAAMLMIDGDFRIQYVNLACHNLLVEFCCYFKSIDPDFDPTAVVGAAITRFLDPKGELGDAITDPARLPFHSDIVAGDQRIHVNASAVRDAAGAQIGCVLALKDATEDRLNRAAIESIDANQVRLEFSVDGHLNSANENFAATVERPLKELIGTSLSDVLERCGDTTTTPTVDLSELSRGEPLTGLFTAQYDAGPRAVFEGIFNLVYDQMGEPLRIVFIGSDITAERAAIEKSESLRTALEQAQKTVVSSLTVALDRLAEGDLTGQIECRFSAEYEGLRHNFNAAIDGLLTAIRNVANSAESIGNEAAGISAAADDLSLRTEQQAATLEDTANAVDELAQSVKLAATGASQASEMASSTKLSAERNVDVVRETVSAMSEIDQGSSEISKIIKVIEDIAFQTNLLALNAGVEAARAGDSGRGFVVVATEVRSLAQRSAESAQEISAPISKSGSQVKRGVGLVDQMGNAFNEIVESVSVFTDKVAGIATAVQEQSTNLDGINNAMADLDQTTRRNAAMFQETTTASHLLTHEAQLLAKTTQNFQTGVARPAEAVTSCVASPEPSERIA